MRYYLPIVFFFSFFSILKAQNEPSSSEILNEIRGLKQVGCVLYLAAHPDDENTRLITWLSKEKKFRTAYMSLTRGDGGQNLIGTETGTELGLLRTQELLKARSLDGGEQYFSRAYDFGYSKTAEETYTFWDEKEILKDVVWVIRNLKPDVIITRFPPDSRGGHGHHTASAMIGIQAFKEAANPNFKFNDARDIKSKVWQAKRIVWNTSKWAYERSGQKFPPDYVLSEDVGGFNSLLGKSYNSIASLARSQHKSQGFGSLIARGSELEYFEHLAGDSATSSIFEGIDMGYGRFGDLKLSKKLESSIGDCIQSFNAEDPSESVDQLFAIKKWVDKIPDAQWNGFIKSKIDKIIAQCLGIWYEALSDRIYSSPRDSFLLKVNMINRSGTAITASMLTFDDLVYPLNKDLEQPNTITELLSTYVQIADNQELISQPFWLKEDINKGMFTMKYPLDIGYPELHPYDNYTLFLSVKGQLIALKGRIHYKWNDRAKGELTRPFEIRPRIAVGVGSDVMVFASDKPKKLQVQIHSFTEQTKGELKLELPLGWVSNPDKVAFETKFKGEIIPVEFEVHPLKNAANGDVKLSVTAEGKTFTRDCHEIIYDHIPYQVLFPTAKSRLVFSDLKVTDKSIAYIEGAGDEVASCLRQIGYKVDQLNPAEISGDDLKKYDVVILGIRAYNTVANIKNVHHYLIDYANAGGKVIVQYNTSSSLIHDELGPYNLKIGRDRITDENSPMTLLAATHPILNSPNKINQDDFKGWVQERGLYFPAEIPKEYTAILETNDPGEKPSQGLLIACDFGKGKYVYTGISFFRELPAGVEGAYRLMVNLIEY